jgi:hypothetical protein
MAESQISLAVDPGRPSTPTLAVRFVGSEIRGRIRKLSIQLGFTRLHDALPQDWAIPDSSIAAQAIEMAQDICPEFMVRHCFRSYCFGALLAARNALPLDRETFFISAMLHDLALAEPHIASPGSFEWIGAKLAHEFCIDKQQSEARATTVHNAIALHTSLGIAHRYPPEIAMLHFGTAMDLFGMRIEEIPDNNLHDILSEYPRGHFKAEFSPCLGHQATIKPDSHIAGAVGVGILDRIKPDLSPA